MQLTQQRQRQKGDAAYFKIRLRVWHRMRRRPFPWRDTDRPFPILLAELLLRRTQAQQVSRVFPAFLAAFPTPEALGAASKSSLRAILGSLGLEWRTDALPQLGRELTVEHGGGVPSQPTALLALTGVGPYVAAAVAIGAYGRLEVPVDTNTARVAIRFFGLRTTGEPRRSPLVRDAVAELISARRPRRSFEGLLDFAALVCRARTPQCSVCPVRTRCAAFRRMGRAVASRRGI